MPVGTRRIQNLRSGLLLGVQNMSTADGGLVIQWDGNGTADHLWTTLLDSDGYFRLRNSNSGKVLGVEGGTTGNGARAVQWADDGTAHHK
ncbi:RICIN domain-containing protein [Saccharothrix sp. NRRL B-16348]|uniref:RICIN domain-containing protein n=1 Tax=Saccharothrix sp. NRRL B-16348 TaxID=1415542 RepID=UPI0012FB4EE8|nr:RICIN domain-containing protein [Saccharothrix sp. NRRL B-16348]